MELSTNKSPGSRLSLRDVLLRTPKVSTQEWLALPLTVRWLVMTRAVVLVMTATSALVGVLPAVRQGQFHAGRLVALMLGLVCAHATNNLVNDYVDSRRGLDTGNYLRRQYGVHVLEDGLVSPAGFRLVIAATGAVALLCGLWLSWLLGTGVLALLLAGAFFVVFYTWPLKHFAMGELAVLLVWGPLMTAGSYYVMVGHVTPVILALSVVYGIGPTLVILGKHIDKLAQDNHKGVRSLPVVLGRARALQLSLGLLLVQWVMALWLLLRGDLPVTGWLMLFSLPAASGLISRLRAPPPRQRPVDYAESVWPLWYAAFAFRYSRDFGALLVAALVLALIV